MIQRLLFCSRGKHSRMRRYAKRRGEDFVSQCRWCHVDLIRDADARWVSRDQYERQQAESALRRNESMTPP